MRGKEIHVDCVSSIDNKFHVMGISNITIIISTVHNLKGPYAGPG